MSESVHATAVLIGAAGILIRGASGAGKSTLAWLLIERGASLVADDRVHLSSCHGRLVATASNALAGRLELRGRGIMRVPFERNVVIRLVVDVVDEAAIERLPDPAQLRAELLGVRLARQPVPGASPRSLLLIAAAVASLGQVGMRTCGQAGFGEDGDPWPQMAVS